MVTNTVQTVIDYVKDISGQTNASNDKIVRALNFGADSYSFLALTASGRYQPDSRNHGDVSRVTTTVTSGTAKLLLESELVTIEQMDILINGVWTKLDPTDYRQERTQTGTGTPTSYDVVGNHAYLYPVPNATFQVRLTYGRAHPRYEVTNLTQELGVNPLHDEYIAFYAADRLLIGAASSNRTQVRNELASLRKDVIELFKNQDKDTARRIKPITNQTFRR